MPVFSLGVSASARRSLPAWASWAWISPAFRPILGLTICVWAFLDIATHVISLVRGGLRFDNCFKHECKPNGKLWSSHANSVGIQAAEVIAAGEVCPASDFARAQRPLRRFLYHTAPAISTATVGVNLAAATEGRTPLKLPAQRTCCRTSLILAGSPFSASSSKCGLLWGIRLRLRACSPRLQRRRRQLICRACKMISRQSAIKRTTESAHLRTSRICRSSQHLRARRKSVVRLAE